MSRIYNAYLEGEDREYAIMEAESNMIFNKLFAMLEMVDIQLELNKEAAEYKVLKESGTYDDLQYLYTEAENEANEKKQSIIQTIANAISSILSSISNGIRNFFNKNKNANPDEMVEVDGEAWDKAQKLDTLWSKIQGVFNSIPNAAKLVGGIGLAIGGLEFTANVAKKKVKRSDRDGIGNKIIDIVDKFNGLISQHTPNIIKTLGDKIGNGVISSLRNVANFIKNIGSKLGFPVGKSEENQDTNNTNNNQGTENNNQNNTGNNNQSGNQATTTKSLAGERPMNASTEDTLFDSDLDSFLETFLSGDFDDSIFEEDTNDNIVVSESDLDNLTIGGISLKNQIEMQESLESDTLIPDDEMKKLSSIFESLENSEIEEN